MRCDVLAVDDDIVDIDKSGLPFEAPKDLVHEGLKDRRSILEAERHSFILMKVSMSTKSRLLAIFVCDFDLLKSLVCVECGEVAFTCELGQNVVDSENWVLIRACDLVNFSIVDTKTVLPLLANQYSRRCPRRV